MRLYSALFRTIEFKSSPPQVLVGGHHNLSFGHALMKDLDDHFMRHDFTVRTLQQGLKVPLPPPLFPTHPPTHQDTHTHTHPVPRHPYPHAGGRGGASTSEPHDCRRNA